MDNFQLKAYAVLNEIDLNKIAISCGIPKKYTWEEPLVLQQDLLEKILGRKFEADRKVYIFSFGSIVLVNVPESDMPSLLKYIKGYEPEIDLNKWKQYTDDYEIRVGRVDTPEISDTHAIVPQYEMFYTELVAIIIAKSVAMEKSEYELGKILDRLEAMIDRLERGKLRLSNRALARTTARVTRHQYNTINYIMILDKPDITWTNSDASLFYEKMSDFFELSDRYTVLTKKTDMLNNIINGFSSVSHFISGMVVEWIIVLLIVVEVVLMIADLLR